MAIFESIKKFGFSKGQLLGISLFVIVGLCHNFIANENYLLCLGGDKTFFVSKSQCTTGLPAIIPYSAQTIDKQNRNVGPFSSQNVSSPYYRHWLGTDSLGRDLLAGLVHGTYIALKISVLAMLLAIMTGVFFGYLSGFLGDKGFRLEKKIMFASLLVLGIAIFYLWYSNGISKILALVLVIVTIGYMINKSDINNNSSNTIAIPFDLITMRIIEVFKAIPDVFVILVLIGMFSKASIMNIILIIGLIRWPTVTRYLRAEIIKIKEEDFILAARALGLSNNKIFKDHILPLAISPVIIASAFGFSQCILLESTLSFLGIGIPLDQVTWGTILNGARSNFSSWWLALFPGLMIFLTVLLFNSLGDRLSDYFRGE